MAAAMALGLAVAREAEGMAPVAQVALEGPWAVAKDLAEAAVAEFAGAAAPAAVETAVAAVVAVG